MLSSKRLKSLRKAINQSQADAAYCMNMSREAYCMYENGYRQPSFDAIITLANYYHVSIDYLVGVSEIPYRFDDFSEPDIRIIHALSVCDLATKKYVCHVLNVPFP